MSEVLVCTQCLIAYEDSGHTNCPHCYRPLIRAKKIGKNMLSFKGKNGSE